jgi:hypothetical protein
VSAVEAHRPSDELTPSAAERVSPSARRADVAGDERRQRPGSRIAELRAEARYSRERYDLYRAKVYGPRPARMARLRELERARDGAAGRLRRAEHAETLQKRA